MAITKDSGERQVFGTGAQRDTQAGKIQLTEDQVHKLVAELAWFQRVKPMEIDSNEYPITERETENVRLDLLDELAQNREAALLGRGALKYSDDNWRKGIPLGRSADSLFRHFIAWYLGDTTEDHLAAIRVNAAFLMWTEHAIRHSDLPRELATAGPLRYWFDIGDEGEGDG